MGGPSVQNREEGAVRERTVSILLLLLDHRIDIRRHTYSDFDRIGRITDERVEHSFDFHHTAECLSVSSVCPEDIRYTLLLVTAWSIIIMIVWIIRVTVHVCPYSSRLSYSSLHMDTPSGYSTGSSSSSYSPPIVFICVCAPCPAYACHIFHCLLLLLICLSPQYPHIVHSLVSHLPLSIFPV